MEAAEILGALLELLALLSPIYGILKNAQSRSSKVMLQDDFGEAVGTMVFSAMFIFAAIFFGTRHGWGNRLITILINGCAVAIQVGFIALIYFTSSAPPDDLNSAFQIALTMGPCLVLALLICFIRDVNRLPSRERFHLLCGLVIVVKYKNISTQHSDDHLIVFTNMINGYYHSNRGYALEYPDNIIPRAHGFGALVLLADLTMKLKLVQELQVMSVFRFLMPLGFLEELRVLDALGWLTGLAFPFIVWEFRLREQRELLKKRGRELHTQARQIVDHPMAWSRLEPVLLELEAGARASSNIWSLMLWDLEMLRVSAAARFNRLARAAQRFVNVFQRGREVIRALKDRVRDRWMNSGSRDEQLVMIIVQRSSAAREFEAAARSRSESGFLGQVRRRFARSRSS